MASNIRLIMEKVATTMPQIVPRSEAATFPFYLYEGDVPLDQCDMPTLYRAFRVQLGASRLPKCNSNRNLTFLRAPLEIVVGYPFHLISKDESIRVGIEATVAEDIADIQIALARERRAALIDIGPVRSLIPESTRRTPRTVIIPFDLEWGQPRT